MHVYGYWLNIISLRAQLYQLPDLRLVRVLPSAEDEINSACFHPQPGGGLAYGTNEGRLRVLRQDSVPLLRGPARDLHSIDDQVHTMSETMSVTSSDTD